MELCAINNIPTASHSHSIMGVLNVVTEFLFFGTWFNFILE